MKPSSMKLDKVALRKYSVIFFVAGVASFFLVDKFLANIVRGVAWLTHNRQSFGFYIFDELGRSKDWVSGAGIALIISSFFLYLKKGNKRRQQLVRYSGRIFLSVFLTSIVVNILKTIAGRYRPYNVTADSELSFYSFKLFQGDYNKLASFPSSHAATVIAIAMTLYYINPTSKYNKYFFGLAGLVMLQRILSLNHYLSDVMIGAGIGLLMAYLSTWFWKNFIKIGE